mgnify:FL=1|tara:strand:- start:4679 stop:5707 length:1029 start_codon:yes stop_codon:yes gene_type:complete
MIKNNIFIENISGKLTSRPPVWFMRQAGRILPSYQKLKEKYSFDELMHDKNLASKVTLLPIDDLGVDAGILFSDILVIPKALGLNLEFTPNGPKFHNALDDQIKSEILKFEPEKLKYIYQNIKEIKFQRPHTPLIGFCGGPLTTLLFMFRRNETNKDFNYVIKLLYKERKKCTEILEMITDASIEYVKNQVDSGIDCFQLFETYCGIIPEEMYTEIVLPFSKRILNAAMEKNCKTIFFPKNYNYGIKELNKGICDIASIDWQIPLETARTLLSNKLGIQGNMDPRLFFSDKKEIEKYLLSLRKFGEVNSNWIFNLGHGFIPGIEVSNVNFVVDWIKNHNWNR